MLSTLAVTLLGGACRAAPGSDREVGATSDTKVGANEDFLQVSIVPDQADAALSILRMRGRAEDVPDEAWQALFSSEGYRRVMDREEGMDRMLGIDRGYTDASFRAWLESDDAMAALAERTEALAVWHEVDAKSAGLRALAYLPVGTTLQATIYPIVRKQTNSFVWDLDGDPAIFMYVEPGNSVADLESTLAHELHHVGLAKACSRSPDRRSTGVSSVDQWMTALGEGMAVLAAAGSVDGPTHTPTDTVGQRLWDEGIDRLPEDLPRIEGFLMALAEGRVEGEEAQRRGMELINEPDAPQGAFYTVGWHMSATIERVFGRAALIDVLCNPPALIERYNEAVARSGIGAVTQPRWSDAFIAWLASSELPS